MGKQRAIDDADIARHYLARKGRFSERTAQLVLVGRYSADFAEMTRRWAQSDIEVVNDWPDQVDDARPHWETLEQIASRSPAGQPSNTSQGISVGGAEPFSA